MADKREIALQKHREWQGKIEVISRAPVNNKEELSASGRQTEPADSGLYYQ